MHMPFKLAMTPTSCFFKLLIVDLFFFFFIFYFILEYS